MLAPGHGPADLFRILDRSTHEFHAFRNVGTVTRAQVIQDAYSESLRQKRTDEMAADEAGTTGDEGGFLRGGSGPGGDF